MFLVIPLRAPKVADAAHGFETLGQLRAKLRTDTTNMHVDGARATLVVETPHVLQKRIARERTTRMAHEERQQRILEIGEVDWLV